MKTLEKYLTLKKVANADEKSRILLAFMALVLERNEKINLTTISEPDLFIEKHLIDSSACFGWPEIKAANRIVDIGTGAGFPGVPLAVLYPEKEFTLIDSLGKRIEFLRDALSELGITNVTLIKSRAEDAGRDKDIRERFDLCLCRAVGSLAVISEYCLPLVKPGGCMYAWKTEGAKMEIDDSLQARLLLGAVKDVDVRPSEQEAANRNTPSLYSHNIMVIKKQNHTPGTYPRRAGTPSRVPL